MPDRPWMFGIYAGHSTPEASNALYRSNLAKGQNRLSIRGVSALEGVSSVGVYMDDTPVTSRQETQLDAILYDLERVEVLRGPQGTLYGEGSIGGTIIFVTNKPDSAAFGARANLEGSSIKGGDKQS